MFTQFEDCCNFALFALDGVYGWVNEIIAIIILVFVVNILLKWILKRLHYRFEKQQKVWKDCFVQALYKPLSYFIWFFAAVQALDLIASRILKDLPILSRHAVIGVGGVLALAWFLMRWKKFIVQRMIAKSKSREMTIDQGKINGIDKIITVAIIFFTILFILEVTNHSITTLTAFGAVGGLALAFASQEIISNFFGGFMIYLTQPFTIGDWILIPDHKIEGIVEEIGWYMTRLRSLDKKPIYIPNSIFSKLIVITPSRMSHREINETIGIRYEDSPKLKQIINDITEMLKQHPEIDHNQPMIVRLAAFGEFSLDISLKVYTETTDTEGFMRIKEDVLFKISDILEKNQAELAYPTHHVTFQNRFSEEK